MSAARAEVHEVVLRVAGDGGRLRVRVESPAGSATGPFELPEGLRRDFCGEEVPAFPEEEGAATRQLVPVARPRRAGAATVDVGEGLHAALFPPAVRRRYDHSRGLARRLRLHLVWDPHDPLAAPLHRLPWELLRDPDGAGHLALDPDLALIRHLDVPGERRPLPRPPRLRVLPLACQPRVLPRLDLSAELAGLAEIEREEIGVEVVMPDRRCALDLLALRRQLAERAIHVLHFMGHGELDREGRGVLFFEGPGQRPRPVSGEALAQCLAGLHDLRLVVLNACRSAEAGARPFAGVAGALVRAGLPSVLAMQAPIPDGAAVAFAHELYRQLARGRPLDLATCEGRQAIHARHPERQEWALPVLFTKPGGETLFDADAVPLGESAAGSGGAIGRGELLDRYLAWVLEHTDEVDVPWPPGAGRRPRMPLTAIHSLFRPVASALDERPRRLDSIAAEQGRLEDLLAVRDLPVEEEHLLLWQELRRAARHGWSGHAAGDGPEASSAEAADLASWNQLLPHHRRLVVLGATGSGKTCLLRWLAQRLAAASRAGQAEVLVEAREIDPRRPQAALVSLGPARVPILVDAGDYARRRRARPSLRFAEYLGYHLGGEDTPVADGRGRPIDPVALRALLHREIVDGGVVLLVDGLDAAGDADERLAVVRELERFLDQFLPPARPSPAESGGSQMVVTSRLPGYALAPFDDRAEHVQVEPLTAAAFDALCWRWEPLLPEGAGALAELRRHVAGDLMATPLIVALLAAGLRHGGGRLPSRRLDLLEPAVTVLLERWADEAPASGAAALGAAPLRDLLAELAADVHDRPERFGLVDRHFLLRWLAERTSTSDVAALDRLLARDLGPLVAYGDGMLGFLHRAFEEYLAACWLAAEPAAAAARLRARRGEPKWRSSAAMAIGLLAERLAPEELESLLLHLFEAPGEGSGDPVPHAELLLIEACGELPPGVDVTIPMTLVARRLTARAAADGGGPFAAALESALAALLTGPAAGAVARGIAASLEPDAGDPGRSAELAASAARIALAAGRVPIPLAAALERARPLDRPPDWPVERALRNAVPPSLPARGSLRAALVREPRLADQVRRDAGWRRLVLAIHGGASDGGGLHRDSPLDGALLSTLRRAAPPESLLPLLLRSAAGEGEETEDARAAIVALGGTATLPKAGDRRRAGDALRRRLAGAPGSQAPPTDLLLRLADNAPAAARPAVIGLLWRRLLWQPPAHPEPRHHLAVLLDTHGAFLTRPLATFVDGWRCAAGDAPTAGEEVDAERLARALDVLATIPQRYDFVRGWALAVLRPLLARHRLLTEAVLLAEVSLGERHDARADTRRRLRRRRAGRPDDQALLALANAVEDPWRRCRALGRLADGVAALRKTIRIDRLTPDGVLLSPWRAAAERIAPQRRGGEAVAAPAHGFCGRSFPLAERIRQGGAADLAPGDDAPLLTLLADEARDDGRGAARVLAAGDERTQDEELADWIERLEVPDDRVRLEAALALHGDRTALRRRWSARHLGVEGLLRLSRAWLRRREEDPRAALVLRWTFAAVDHDSPEVLLTLADRAGWTDPDGIEAEAVLRHLEQVDDEALAALAEILRQGSPRARRSLIEALPNLLASADERPDAVWATIADLLPAVDCAGERVDLSGPEAVVAAAERAWNERGNLDDLTVERTEAIHQEGLVPWSDLLGGNRAALRRALQDVGRLRRVGAESRSRCARAAERVFPQPMVLRLLVAWLERRLAADLRRAGPDDHTLSHLLGVVAAAARRLPRTYFEATAARPGWRRLLRRAVEEADWLGSRRDAVELLALGRQLGEDDLAALATALGDGPEVQRAALESLARYRRVDHPEVLDRTAADLTGAAPSRAFAAARLLAAIARPTYCDDRIRRRVEAALIAAIEHPAARRDVYVATYEDSPTSRAAGVACLGRLDRLLRKLLLEIAGEPAAPPASPCPAAREAAA